MSEKSDEEISWSAFDNCLRRCAYPTPEGGGEVVESARRIVAWDDNGRLADDEWLVERNETAMIAICRALLSSLDARREALEEAARVADEMAGHLKHLGATIHPLVQIGSHLETCKTIASAIRALKETKP